MVKRVYGKLNGAEILLHQDPQGNWSIPVPLNEDGVYIAEIIAEDDAGNVSYLAKMLFEINDAVVMAYLVPIDYQGEILELYDSCLIMNGFATKLIIDFTTHCLNRPYSAEVLIDP